MDGGGGGGFLTLDFINCEFFGGEVDVTGNEIRFVDGVGGGGGGGGRRRDALLDCEVAAFGGSGGLRITLWCCDMLLFGVGCCWYNAGVGTDDCLNIFIILGKYDGEVGGTYWGVCEINWIDSCLSDMTNGVVSVFSVVIVFSTLIKILFKLIKWFYKII